MITVYVLASRKLPVEGYVEEWGEGAYEVFGYVKNVLVLFS
jgi:hypothetical protein